MDETIVSRTLPPTSRRPPTRPGPHFRTAWWLTGLIAVLTLAAATTGLWRDDLYPGPAVLVARFRGNDLATLAAGVPLLLAALAGSVRGSPRADLVWVGMLAYSVYNYAYYIYDPVYIDLFLLHVTIVVLSATALVLALTELDVAPHAPAAMRWVSGLLILPAVSMIGMYATTIVRQAVTGQVPADVLPLPPAQVHLGQALDLTMIAPPLVLAGLLLWRRTAWGYALGVATCVYVGAYQLNYLAARYFVAEAGAPGVAHFDPLDLVIPALLLPAVLVLLHHPRRRLHR
ncbi:hypothetical protein [Sphaerisporangium dianthi]|uniref:Uncharacterized protein n=1 Tax=Sphaerisporangium dianthi TaxID=1436120 RepID=A0ABV9CUP7_9ACTN